MWISIFIQPDDGGLAFGVGALGKLSNMNVSRALQKS
jgi:hypothetical protein